MQNSAAPQITPVHTFTHPWRRAHIQAYWTAGACVGVFHQSALPSGASQIANSPSRQSKIQHSDMTMRRWGNETGTNLSRYVCQEVSNKFPRTFQGMAACWKVFIQTKSEAWYRTFQISKPLSLLTHVPSHLLEGYEKQPSRSPFCYFIECWR